MALSAKLELRQGQQLVMTPQLQQAIRLLQLSNLELVDFVEQELERNPLLERDERGDGAPAASGVDAEPVTDMVAHPGTAEMALDLGLPAADTTGAFDTDIENVYPDTARAELGVETPDRPGADLGPGIGSTRQSATGAGSFEDNNLEAYVASEITLRDHLSAQAALAFGSPVEQLIARHLIDLVDESGYVAADLDDLAEKLGAPKALIEGVLRELQTFDPPGVCARSLAECLAIQLKEQNRFDPAISKLLENLALLAAHNMAALRKAVACDFDDLTEMILEIKRLNPKPGLKFGSVSVQPVVPDVFVRPASDGSWIVELNSETLPRVLVNRSYLTRVQRSAHTPRDKEYLQDCLQSATWLTKSLDQRARTILRVSEEIVRQQDGFFAHGVRHLRPLNLKTIAEKIGMHESTVSRVTSNKYMATTRGIFELKFFFTSAIQAACVGGEAHSSESVRHRIKAMIDGEGAADVLSDDAIVDALRNDGIEIARRTVAKYREGMKIPSSVLRRRQKRMVSA